MSKLFVPFLPIFLFFTLVSVVLAADITISPPNITASPNSQFTINVNVANVSSLFGAAFDLIFDPAVLQFVSAQKGTFLEQCGSTNLLTTLDTPGHLIIGYSILGQSTGVSGGGSLMTITFHSLSVGTSNLTFQNNALCDASSISGCNIIPANWNGGLATIESTSPPSPTPTNYSLTAPTTAQLNIPFNISWSASQADDFTFDWIGIFPIGAPDMGGYVSWQYTNLFANGALSFVLNTPGTYEARYFKNDGFAKVAVSPSFIIENTTGGETDGGGASGGIFTLTLPSQTVPINSEISVNFETSGPQSQTDWIGMYRVGDADSQYITWQYTNGLQSGTLVFTAPSEPGTYEFRYFLNNGFEKAAISPVFGVVQ